jgi:hypothetical protein
MRDAPAYLLQLLSEGSVASGHISARGRALLKPLLAGGVVVVVASGRGESLNVHDPARYREWLECQFPSAGGTWISPIGSTRAKAIAQRRDSKIGTSTIVKGCLHFRSLVETARVIVDGNDIDVVAATARFGVAACVVGATTELEIVGGIALVENLEMFFHIESVGCRAAVALNSAGRVSERVLQCLARSNLHGQLLWHLPDYDPVGLADYIRIRNVLGDRARLFLPQDFDSRFKRFSNRALLQSKPRNRTLLEQLANRDWPCSDSRRVFEMIKETGAGLEQESLLLSLA